MIRMLLSWADWNICLPLWRTQNGLQNVGSLSWGKDVAQKICEYDQRIPATVLRLSSPDDESLLAAEGI